jgi:hypothetical protein
MNASLYTAFKPFGRKQYLQCHLTMQAIPHSQCNAGNWH